MKCENCNGKGFTTSLSNPCLVCHSSGQVDKFPSEPGLCGYGDKSCRDIQERGGKACSDHPLNHEHKAMKCKCGKPLESRRCESCQVIATHYNEKTGEVYSWMTITAYEAACEEMQGQLDDAFDNQYFGE